MAAIASGCSGHASDPTAPALDRVAESYVRLMLALGERDADSLDAYHGPPQWQTDARARHATLRDIRAAAASEAEPLVSAHSAGDEIRRRFLVRQLTAIVARVDIVLGTRQPFAEETRALFAFDVTADADDSAAAKVRAEIDRLIPGRGHLTERYATFDRAFLIAPDRLSAVLSRAIEGCRAATRAHVNLPAAEQVKVEYVRDLPWSAFTRYQGGFRSRIQVNAALPLTVDRALDLACHEAYPGHHTIETLLEARFGATRAEFLVQALFSPQSMLHEAAAAVAGTLAFPEQARTAFERDELFPLAGLDPDGAERHVRVARLVDRLHSVQAAIARRYLDGELDFPRAAAALERDALMYSPDATLKFLNQYRTYAATYTYGRDVIAGYLSEAGGEQDTSALWRKYTALVSDAEQILPPASATTVR